MMVAVPAMGGDRKLASLRGSVPKFVLEIAPYVFQSYCFQGIFILRKGKLWLYFETQIIITKDLPAQSVTNITSSR